MGFRAEPSCFNLKMTANGTHYYKYRTRSRKDPGDLQKQLELQLIEAEREEKIKREQSKDKTNLDLYIEDTNFILSTSKRISSIQKQLKSCEGVIADIEKFQSKIRKRKEFSKIDCRINSGQGRPCPRNIPEDMWERFLAFEKFQQLKKSTGKITGPSIN